MRSRSERALAGALAALVLVSTLAAVPGAALAINSAVSAQVGDDLATVPDANIQANIPQDARDQISYNISEWRGSVMADQAADSMEVTLTTREAATGQATPGDPQFALQLTDDDVPDGRTVAVPADAIEQAVGYQPVVVTGYHEDGSQWTASARERGGLIVFDVPHFSTNTVTFGGTLSITGSPATDGSSYSYEVQDVDAVSDFQIGVTGSTAYDRENASARVGNGGSVPVEIAGNSDPLGPDGASTPQVALEGVESTNRQSTVWNGVTNGDSKGLSIGGNQQPRDPSVEVTGRETTTSQTTSTTASNGQTDSFTVDGNVAPSGPASGEPQLTWTGNTQTSSSSDSGSASADGGSGSLSIGGNLEPTGPAGGEPELSVTANSASSVTVSAYDEAGASTTDIARFLVGSSEESSSTGAQSELGIKPSSSGSLSSLRVYINETEGTEYNPGVNVSIVEEAPDGEYGEGQTVTTGWNPSWSTGWQTIPVDSDVSVTAGQSYTVELTTTNPYYSRTGVQIGVSTDENKPWFSGEVYSEPLENTPRWEMDLEAPIDVDASANDGTSANLGSLSAGQTATAPFDVSDSASSISFSNTNPGGSLDWSLDYTERTATEDPALDWDDDGQAEASYSGILTEGQTATTALPDLTTGSHTATTSMAGGSVDWAIDWTAITATENPTVQIDGGNEASYNGVLRGGEQTTLTPLNFGLSSNSITFGAAGGSQFDANLSWTEVTHTEDPSVDVDGDGSYEINEVGTLSPGTVQTFDAPGVTRSVSELGIATNNATMVRAEARYREVTKTEDPTIEVNGQQTSHLGQLSDGETVQLDTDPSWVQSGTNRINVSLGDGTLSADAPQSEVNLDYQHESVDNQTVQYTAQRWSERYNVSRKWLSDQSSASLTIPFKDTVLSIRSVEKRVGNNDWTELQSSDYDLTDGQLTVQLGSINKNTEVGVRVDASRVRVNNGSIHVQEATEQGRKLDTQIAIDDWADDAYIQLPQREDNLIAYAYNESWSGPTDDLRVTADGERRLRLPNALAGGNARIATLPVEAAPQTGDVVLSVGQPSSTEPKFVVQPGQTPGDDVEYTFVGAADGTDYILYSQSNGIVRDSGTASSPLTLSDDDSDETLQFLVDEGEAGGPDDGSGSSLTLGNAPAVAVEQAQANPLGALLVAIIALTVLLGAYWAAKRRRRPRKGWIGEFASFVSTEVVLIGLSIIAIVAALRFNVLALPRQALFVGAVFGIELLGYLLLRYFGYFDWKIYGAASGIVLIASTQILVPEAFEQLLGSDALTRTLPLVAAFGMYILYRVVEGWRRGQVTQVVVGGEKQN